MEEFMASRDGKPDDQFLNDLSAAVRLKTFLVGSGRLVPAPVTKGLADLVSKFEGDVAAYEQQVRMEEQNSRWWHKFRVLFGRSPRSGTPLPTA